MDNHELTIWLLAMGAALAGLVVLRVMV